MEDECNEMISVVLFASCLGTTLSFMQAIASGSTQSIAKSP